MESSFALCPTCESLLRGDEAECPNCGTFIQLDAASVEPARPVEAASAAVPAYKYRVLRAALEEDLERLLNAAAVDGWELVNAYGWPLDGGGAAHFAVLRRR